ncbi:MAG: MmcQ-like protein [Deltaproteobacteria bacterium CG2_30_63_29]|nr:MAG: MmcQ-like protein [Deltaproteobacteria bacterium CG2_30_63_29]PIV98824.1 MAG: MmcQ-like protein [Deltaproteobacteria bacterium CG17_big_fil_post_rev_8_21_14_2_50_63_7]PJB44805.1 MAG: MmcQ-like protein [Deltaproteobacteria bacterium CG_4_9_14_3_um_filter_63_12]
MTFEKLREYCLALPGVSEELPFDDVTVVFKVMGKIFALTNLHERPLSLNLKCEPARAIELRDQFEAVQPGYHMNKKHWNTVTVDETISSAKLVEWIDHSYELVAKGLKKADRDALSKLSRR